MQSSEATQSNAGKADQANEGDKSNSLVSLAEDIEAHSEHDDAVNTAITLYQQTVALSGDAPDANVRLGDACMRANRITQAIKAYRAALIKDPNNNDALLGLGAALVQRGAIDEGLADLAKAAPRVNTGTAYNRLGVAQMMVGQFAKAQNTFNKGRTVAPNDLDIATNFALAAALAGKADDAAALVQEIVQSPAAEERHRRNLVIALVLIGRSDDEARAAAPPELPQQEITALLERAKAIRNMSDPKARAKALGIMKG